MKTSKMYLTIVVLLTALMSIQMTANAQQKLTLKAQATYVNSQIDTITITNRRWTHPASIWIKGRWTDTVSVILNLYGRVAGETSWNLVTAFLDTTTYANTGEYNKGYTVRSTTIDRYAGIDVEFQLRLAYQSTGNGFLVDNKYDLVWWVDR